MNSMHSSDDLFFQQRIRYIQSELDHLLTSETPRGTLSDKSGALKLSIERVVQDAVSRALAAQQEDYHRKFEELHQRLSFLEEKLGGDSKSSRTSLFKDKLHLTKKGRGKSPGRDKADKLLSTSLQSTRNRPSSSSSIAPEPRLSLSYTLPPVRNEELFKEAALLKAQQKRAPDDTQPLFNVFDHPDLFQYELGYGATYRTLFDSASEHTLIDAHLDENFYLAHFFGLHQTHYYVPEEYASGPMIITVLDLSLIHISEPTRRS